MLVTVHLPMLKNTYCDFNNALVNAEIDMH